MPNDNSTSGLGSRLSNSGKRIFRFFLDLVDAARIAFFVLFFAICVIRFWVGFASFFLAFFNLIVRLLTTPLALVAGLPSVTSKNEAVVPYGTRAKIYLNIFREIADVLRSRLNATWVIMSVFSNLTTGRKVITLIMTALFVMAPFAYLIPRPNEVYVTESNSLGERSRLTVEQPGYLIIGHDIDDPDHTRAYRNEDAWWLLKFNSQGLKAKIRTGRRYRFYVVGLRIYAPIVLYPNIIGATEIDDNGNEVNSSDE